MTRQRLNTLPSYQSTGYQLPAIAGLIEEESSCNVCSANEYEASMTEDRKGNSICTDCYDKAYYDLGSDIPDIDGEMW